MPDHSVRPKSTKATKAGLEELQNLFSIRDMLAKCASLDDLVRKAVCVTQRQIQSQTASLFLYSKDGMLERRAFAGFDKSGAPIGNQWFPEERYASGVSFTGKVVIPRQGSPFGQPQWTARLREEDLDHPSFQRYRHTLGAISCVAAVPLNGASRSFGVLEIINKLKPLNQSMAYSQFTSDDLYWLSLVGITTAAAVSLLRQKDRLALQTFISHAIPKPLHGEDPQMTFDRIAEKLTGPLTSYKACIIRLGPSPGMLELTTRGGDEIAWIDRIEAPTHPGILYGKVLSKGEKLIINDIEARASEFTNAAWIHANQLRSYACFPLLLNTRVIGVLGLYAGYKNAFESEDISFIENICLLLASLAESFHISGRLRLDDVALQDERHSIIGTARAVSYDRILTELRHKHKNFLIDLLPSLKSVRRELSGRLARQLDQQIHRIATMVDSVVDDFATAKHSQVNLDHIVQIVMSYFKRELSHQHITFSFDRGNIPDIEASDAEFKDVLVNLISNAIKAIEVAEQKHGIINISTRVMSSERRDLIELQVSDNGCGIRNEDLDLIFDAGFTRYDSGTGMGLFITKGTISNYDGIIKAESSVGKGSTFTIHLPLKRLRWDG